MASILKAGRHVAMWSVGAGTAIPFILPTVLAEDKPVSSPCCHGEIKPSQLPIYDEPEDLYDITYHVSGKGKLQEGVEVVRKEVEDALESTKELRDRVDHIYQTGKAHTAGQIAYLREEENLPARAGAIAAGGLVGLLLGARGRIIKKLLYTSVGAGATGAVLYPEYSKLYSQDLWHNANTYAMVAYNFCVGVKPQVNGSGSGSEETAATSPVDSGKSKSLDARGMEVSNPYPSLLTLPYTTLFRKQESSLAFLPRDKPAGLSDASLDRMAEDASQVSMLGFRLQESEKQVTGGALSGFGAVAQEDSSKCMKCGKKKRAHKKKSEDHEVTKFGLTAPSMVDSVQLSVPVVENSIETSKKGIVDKIKSVSKEAADFIDELKTATEIVSDVSEKVIVGAKTVQKVLDTVEMVASLTPVVGIDVAVATKRAAGEVGILVGVASKVKQAAEKAETVLDTVKKVAVDIESLAERVSDLDGDLLTDKETDGDASKKGDEEVLEAVAGEASKVVDVIKTGTELVAEISDKVEAGAKVAEKFAETLEKSECLPQVVGAGVAIVAKEAAVVAGIAGEVNQASENAEKVLDSLAEVVAKVETLVEKVSSLEEHVPAAAGKNVELQSETCAVSTADTHDEAKSQHSLFDTLTSFFSSKKATESVPSKFIDFLPSQQLKTDQGSSEGASDSKNITPSQEPTADTNANEYLEAKTETPPDFDASKDLPIDENEATPQDGTLDDMRFSKLEVAHATKDEEILAAETMNMEDTKSKPGGAMALDIATANPEEAIEATDKSVDQSEIDTKIYVLKDVNNQQNPPSEIEELSEKKSLFSRVSDLFGSKEPVKIQNDTQASPLSDPSEMLASGGLKPKVDVVTKLEADNNQSPVATPTLELSSQKNFDATSIQSQSCVLPTSNSENTQVPVTEAQSATLLLEAPASLSEAAKELATKTEITAPVTSSKPALPETFAQEPETVDQKPETVADQESALPKTAATQETALPETAAIQNTAFPETADYQKITLSETVTTQETALPEKVCQETVTHGPAVPGTVTLDHTLPEIVSQEPTAPQAISITKESEPPLVVATTTHAEQAAAVVQNKPGVTVTQSDKDVILYSGASSLILPAEPDTTDAVITAPLVRQLDGYTIVETPGTTDDITNTLEDEAAADFEVTETIKSTGTSVSSKPGLYSLSNESSKINQPTTPKTKLMAPSANNVSQSTMSDAKNREENSTGKGASQATEKAKDVVVRAEADKKGGGETKHEIDHGQSNPEDVDMYTTRS